MMPSVVLRGPEDDLVLRPIIDTSLRDFEPTGDEDADVLELTRLTLRSLEGMIRAYPDQWFIFRRMWQGPGVAAAPRGELAEGV
jgi:lauroyl/myristoyl acyltransferase